MSGYLLHKMSAWLDADSFFLRSKHTGQAGPPMDMVAVERVFSHVGNTQRSAVLWYREA